MPTLRRASAGEPSSVRAGASPEGSSWIVLSLPVQRPVVGAQQPKGTPAWRYMQVVATLYIN